MKKIVSIILVVLLVVLSAGCSGTSGTGSSKYKVGIIQYMSHPSLDNCYNGIVAGLDEEGIEYELVYQTGSSASADSDCINYAKNMVADGCDIIIGIATNAAKAAFAATDDTDIPVIFCAVSDPIAAKLVDDMEKPGYACSGTSDELNLDAQVDLIQSMQPDVKSIGILYTSSEDNSISNLANFRTICDARGIEVVAVAVQGASDVPSAAEELASKVDCINNFTDNNVVNNLSVVLNAADKYGIPVYGSEETQVQKGCLASVSIDYVALGKVTGRMAAEALKGADVSAMPVQRISDADAVINSDVLAKLSIELPEKYKESAFVVTE